MMRRTNNVLCLSICVGLWLLPCDRLDATGPPPDLYLEWIVNGRAVTDAPPITGASGETVELAYRIRNVGGRDAFCVVITAQTALGRVSPPRRIQPGPKAGAAFDRTLSMALARGMRELCVEVALQNLDAEDPEDPEPANNRRCRRVQTNETAGKHDGASVVGKGPR
jgi:hypothetical protein